MSTEIAPIFRVADGHLAAAWYERLGFAVTGEHRFAPTLPLYLFLDRDGVAIHLSEHIGDAKGPGLLYMFVDDIESIATEFGIEIEDQPWAREIKLTDPDGNRLRIGQRPTTK